MEGQRGVEGRREGKEIREGNRWEGGGGRAGEVTRPIASTASALVILRRRRRGSNPRSAGSASLVSLRPRLSLGLSPWTTGRRQEQKRVKLWSLVVFCAANYVAVSPSVAVSVSGRLPAALPSVPPLALVPAGSLVAASVSRRRVGRGFASVFPVDERTGCG